MYLPRVLVAIFFLHRIAGVALLLLSPVPWYSGHVGNETVHYAPNQMWVKDGDAELSEWIWPADCGDTKHIDDVVGKGNALAAPFESVLRNDRCEELGTSYAVYIAFMAVNTVLVAIHLARHSPERRQNIIVLVLLGLVFVAELLTGLVVLMVADIVSPNAVSTAEAGRWLYLVFATVAPSLILDGYYALKRTDFGFSGSLTGALL